MEDHQAHSSDTRPSSLQQDITCGLEATRDDGAHPLKGYRCIRTKYVFISPRLCRLTIVLESAPASAPRALCREAALSIMRNLPSSLVDHTTLSKVSIFKYSDTLHVDHPTGNHADGLSPV